MKKLHSILAVVAITGSLTLSGCIHVEREVDDETTTTTRTTTLRSPVAPSTTVERTTVVND